MHCCCDVINKKGLLLSDVNQLQQFNNSVATEGSFVKMKTDQITDRPKLVLKFKTIQKFKKP